MASYTIWPVYFCVSAFLEKLTIQIEPLKISVKQNLRRLQLSSIFTKFKKEIYAALFQPA
jgi:hypothetical protein